MNNRFKKFLASMLTAVMLLSMLPTSVIADSAVEPMLLASEDLTDESAVDTTEESIDESVEESIDELVVESTEEPTVEPTEELVVEPTVEPTPEPPVGDSDENTAAAPVSRFDGYKTLDDFGISSAASFSLRRSATTSTYLNPQTIRPDSSYYGYRWICNRSGYSYPFTASFTLASDYMPQNSVYIAIENYDCDEIGNSYSCEYDQVYINGHCIGVLTGNDGTSNTTLLRVDRSYLKAGTNNITIRVGIKIKRPYYVYWSDPAGTIHTDDPYSQWWLRVDDIQVLCDGGSNEGKPDVFSVNLTNAELSGNQVHCYVTTQVEDSQNRTFSLEYALYDWSSEESATYGQIIDDDFATIRSGNYKHEGFLTMPVNSLSGTYTSVVYLKVSENGEDTILAYDEESFEYETGFAPAFDVRNFKATPANLEWTSESVAINLSADIDVNAGLTNLVFRISDAIQTSASVDANGHVTGTLVLPENGFYTVELHYVKEGKAYKKTTNVEINNILTPLDAPVLNASGDFNIAEGETVSISWNPVKNATAYSIIVWDFTNAAENAYEVDRVNDQSGRSYSYTFDKAGTYIIGVYSRCPGSTKYCQSRTAGSVNVYVTANALTCPHEHKKAYYDNGALPPQFSNITVTHHDVRNGYMMFCEDCKQYTGETGYFDAVPELHIFAAGDVCVCGYDRNNCVHKATADSTRHIGIICQQNNAATHYVVADKYMYTCEYCDKTDCIAVIPRSEDQWEPKEHEWDKDSVCQSEGCAYACEHTKYTTAWVDGVSKTVSITDNKDGATHTHVYTAKATCSNCQKDLGMMEETNSAEEHRVRDGKAYYTVVEGGHQKVTPRVCTCGYEENSVSLIEAHTVANTTNGAKDYKDEGVFHSVWQEQVKTCKCGVVVEKVYNRIVKNGVHVDKDHNYKCDLCGGSVSYYSSPTYTKIDGISINYNGKDYPISFPEYDNSTKSNYDMTYGGWVTIYEKVYRVDNYDFAGFLSGMDFDSEATVGEGGAPVPQPGLAGTSGSSIDSANISNQGTKINTVSGGISILYQAIDNWNVQNFKVVLQEKEDDPSQRRTLLLLGNDEVYRQGYTDSTKVLSAICYNNMAFYYVDLPEGVDITDNAAIADWIIRKSGLPLPTGGESSDNNDYQYDMVISYSNNWLRNGESFNKYIALNENGEAYIIERIMPGDTYELRGYYMNNILEETYLRNFMPYDVSDDLKSYLLQPTSINISEFLKMIEDDAELQIIQN